MYTRALLNASVKLSDKDAFFELRQLSAYRISDLAASGTHYLAVTQTKELLAWVLTSPTFN